MASQNSSHHFEHAFDLDGSIQHSEGAFTQRIRQAARALAGGNLGRANDDRWRWLLESAEQLKDKVDLLLSQ